MELVYRDPNECKKALESLKIDNVTIKGYLSLSEFHGELWFMYYFHATTVYMTN